MKDEKNKIKACDDLDGGSNEMAEEIELRKRKDENTWNQNLFIKNKLQRKGLNTWRK